MMSVLVVLWPVIITHETLKLFLFDFLRASKKKMFCLPLSVSRFQLELLLSDYDEFYELVLGAKKSALVFVQIFFS
jgi:hypothetical protein